MLTMGNFLGGQWANESWGRYWGWDPKETWALISILLHKVVSKLKDFDSRFMILCSWLTALWWQPRVIRIIT